VTSLIREPVSTKKEILKYLLKNPQSQALKIASSLKISAQAIRRHLKDLESEGLVGYEAVQSGMGRPQYLFSLSKEGKEQFPNRYSNFAVSFLDAVSETFGENKLDEVLRQQWKNKAHEYCSNIGQGSLEQRLAKLVDLRQEEGYMAEIHHQSDGAFIYCEHHCAIAEVVESYPNVCSHELEMFAEILPDVLVERTHWFKEGENICGYIIKEKIR
jgi:DeoR family suf operon transcriptional repressor